KVTHFEILCRVYGIIPTVGLFWFFYVNSKKSGWMSFSKRSDNASVCYTKPIDSLKNWNNHFFWVDDFACPASFSWHTAKHVIRDPSPVAADFNEQDYATLVAHPSSFQKFLEAFLCLVGLSRHYTLDEETYPRFLHKNGEEMDIFAFIHTIDPTKVKIVEREWNEGEPLLLETTIGRTVPLLPVAPDRAESELNASVERIFDEGGSCNQTEQRDSTGGGKDVDPASEASHPPKKLREDHGPPSGTSVGGKYMSAVKRLLVGAVLNTEVRVAAIPTFPFITASISTMPERKGGDHTDSVAGLNLHAIGAPPRFVISLDSSYHSSTNVAKASLVRCSVLTMTTVTTITSMVDPASVAKEKLVEPSSFCTGSSSAGGTDPTTGGFSDLTGNDFLVGAIRTIVDEFAPSKFFTSIRGMEHDQLFTEFNVGAAHQMSLNAKVRMRAEYNVKEKRRLKFVIERQVELLKVREGEIENLKAKLLLRETEAMEECNAILKKERNALDVKVTELEASGTGKEHELTDLNALVTFVKSQNDNLVDWVHELETSSFGLQEKVTVYENCMDQLEKFQDDRMKVVNYKFDKLWLLTHGMELAIIKYLNLSEYISALGAAIGKAIEKVMQDRLSDRITHGKEGKLRNVNFSLLAKLKSNKDSSVKTVMDILRLEGPLAEKLGLNELQPDVDQLMVPIHRSSDKVVLGATALSLALDFSSVRPFSAVVLTCTEGTFDIVSATANTTTALSTTFASTSSIAPISVDDYEVVGADDQMVADGNAASFPNVDDAKFTSLTSYGSSHLGPSFHVSSARLASLLRSTSAVLSVGMPISAGMTASVPYVNENGVSPLLDFIMVSSVRYSKIGVIQVSPSSSTTASISTSLIDFYFSSSTNTCLLKCAKLVDAILLSASAFLFSLLGTCLIENALKLLVSVLTFSSYRIMSASFATYVPFIWLATNCESTFSLRFLTPICSAILNPEIKGSYSASLFVVSNLNLRAYVNFIPSRFMSISLAPEPSVQDDPFVNKIHGSGSSSSNSIRVSKESSSGHSTMKSANICPLIDTLDL
ncbi:hypothetical protein Tco_0400331, partial [Tanacetum coccineum]